MMKTKSTEKMITTALAVLMAGVFILTGCNKKSAKGYGAPQVNALKESKLSTKSFASGARASNAVYSDSIEYEMAEESSDFDNSRSQNAEYERKLIRTGNVTLEVKTVSDAEEKISAWAKSLGGYITNANTWENGAGFTVRVPASRFDDAMAQTGEFGRVTNRSVSSQDVSDNYYDLQSRLQTKYILRDKLTGYLNQAKDIKDLLEIERQLNSVLEDIDSTEGRFKRLSGQIDFSTIYINMQFERGKDEGGIILPDVKNSWNEFVSTVIAFFWGLLKILFYIVIFGIPLIAVAAFLFWLLFGKVGLLVRLFKKLKK